MPEPTRESITGAVLAGGAGRRMGGVDKGLVSLNDRPLVSWALDALRPQVSTLLINANRSLEQYRAFGWPIVADSGDGFQGPLAGMLAVLGAAQTEFVLTVPCDTPRVPPDLAARLGTALTDTGAEIVVVRVADRLHPVHALMRRDVYRGLLADFSAGERKVARWQATRRCVELNCDDIADAFVNINTPEQRDALAQVLRQVT